MHNSNGGAINMQGGTLKIEKSSFLNNKAQGGHGGAIYIKNSNDANNKIHDTTFTSNEADKEGSAIYTNSKDGGLTVTKSTFNRNYVQKPSDATIGGTITTYNGYLTIDDCNFESNEAKGRGGALYVESKLTLNNSRYNYNQAHNQYGGAIYYNHGEDLKITNSKFRCNHGGNDGGAIYINKNVDINIEKCIFEYNRAEENSRITSGGAIYNDGSGTLTLTNTSFLSNRVQSPFNPFQQILYDFKGGAVYSNHDITIDGCYFENNYARDAGGAVYTSSGITWGENPSTFIGNYAKVDKLLNIIATKGGAVYAGTFKNTAKRLIFKDNVAGYGGAVYINNKNEITFESCDFEFNSARIYKGTSYGAAIYIDSSRSELYLRNNIFVGNAASEDRGVYNCGYYETVKNNWFGTNNVNFDDGYLVEWHKFGSDTKIADESPAIQKSYFH